MFERLFETLATPGPRRWNIYSFSFLVPVLFASLLQDWFGFEDAFVQPSQPDIRGPVLP